MSGFVQKKRAKKDLVSIRKIGSA